MRLWVVAVGTRMPGWVTTAFDDYAQRLPADFALSLKEVKAEVRLPFDQGQTGREPAPAKRRQLSTR